MMHFRTFRTSAYIAAFVALALSLGCEQRAIGGSPGAAATDAARAALPNGVRAHNAMVEIPTGWARSDMWSEMDRSLALYPVDYPDGEHVKISAGFAQPAEQGMAWLAQQFLDDPGIERLAPDTVATHPRGYEMVTQKLSMIETGVGRVHMLVSHVDGGYRGQTFYLKVSRPEFLERYRPAFEQFVNSAVILSSIELAPEVGEYGSLDLYDVYRMQDYLEWLLDAKVTDAQRGQIQAHLTQAWRKGDPESGRAIVETLEFRDSLKAKEPAEQKFARVSLRTESLKQWRAEAKRGDAKANLMLEIYSAAQPALAGGAAGTDELSLTRHTSDGLLDLMYFIASKVANPNGTVAEPKKEALESWAAEMAKVYPTLAAAEKEMLADVPVLAAGLKFAWPKLSEEQRAEMLAGWKELPFVQELANAKSAQDAHAQELRQIMRSFDAHQQLRYMGAYNLNPRYFRW